MWTAFVLTAVMQDPAAEAPGQRLTADDLRAAARVIGLELTDAELEMMRIDVSEHLDQYEQLRAPSLDNAVLPALVFSPLAPGIEIRRRVADEIWEEDDAPVPAPVRPADLEELAFADVATLGRHLRAGTVTCVELTEMYLARLERLDRDLHCVITLLPERALEQAASCDLELAAGTDRGPLHGIPWGVKDLMAVAGARTTWGAKPFEDQVIDADATVVRRLDEAGAVLLAKLSVGALAWGDVWFGAQTRSPWNAEIGSSGSSAGPSSATAAGGVAFALGTETLGSIISPSVRCGNSSLRPTFGRVSRHGCMALSWSMDKVGPICRSLADAALVLDAIQGPDGLDPSVHDVPFDKPAGVLVGEDLRVGYDPDWFGKEEATRAVLDDLRAMGVELVEVTLPELPVEAMLITLSAEGATAFDELTRSGADDLLVRQARRAWPNVFRAARLIPAVEYLRAQRLRTELMLAMHAALADVDCLVHPPYAGGLLSITNLTGHPTVTAPFGEHAQGRMRGAPYTVCFTGQLFGEEVLLGLADAWQRRTGHHLRHPALAPPASPASEDGR